MAFVWPFSANSAWPRSRSQTIASQIATTFNEAGIGIETSSLIALGLVLLAITMALNVVARLLVWRVSGPTTETA